jgi:tetratricopeptide (TPR) repeat protein
MQRKIFDGEAPPLWKDYFLLGKIYFNNKNVEEAMKFLFKAREMVRIQDLKEF